MIDVKGLVPQLQRQVKLLIEDLIEQARKVASIETFLRAEHQKALETGTLSQSYAEWSEEYLEQVAVSWVLSCVFVRFLEDNHLIDECWIAGVGDRGKLADGSYEIYFRNHPHESDREYLKFAFHEVGKIPAARELFEGETVTLWAVDPSGDAARSLLMFFKEVDPEKGGLKRWFGTGASNSRQTEYRGGVSFTLEVTQLALELAKDTQFLGDLYQDLSEHARKKYALLQTPEFVQQFILDRTLTPAINKFGLKGLRLIDPACGSGHFLLGAFDRLFALWMNQPEVRENAVVAAQNAFDSIFGVDINPFAVAITRFRMLVAAVRACGINRLHNQSYAWKLNLAVGDSLLRGSRPTFGEGRDRIMLQQVIEFEPINKLRTEDPAEANRILDQGYHVVVGNPPYITVKDKAQNQKYRDVYSTCHRQYSLGVPFTQRFWDLAIRKGERITSNSEAFSPSAGCVGMITANSFMKREFGTKLIEEFFPKTDLTHVIDTSEVPLPGHGTPTVILFGRPRKPMDSTIRAVLGIKGENPPPNDPATGKVWQSILKQVDIAGAQDEFMSTADVPREMFASHPWSIGGGGAGDVKDIIEKNSDATLSELIDLIGYICMTRADELYFAPRTALRRAGFSEENIVKLAEGDIIRDWVLSQPNTAVFPYDAHLKPVTEVPQSVVIRFLWPHRTALWLRKEIGGTQRELGMTWYEWNRFQRERFRLPHFLAFAFVATHNHFVLEESGKVFKQSAPIIKLPADATKDDHLALLGLLNSSTACFWMKQSFHNKGGQGVNEGAKAEHWEKFYEFTGTGLERFPVPEGKPLALSRRLDGIARQLCDHSACHILERWKEGQDLKNRIEEAEVTTLRLRGRMIALQEELDWECHQHYGVLDGVLADNLNYAHDDMPELRLGERAFEIVMARQLKRGELQTAWYERHGSIPITEIPSHWPAAYRNVVERRINLIETCKDVGLIERPEYKRRWNSESWAGQQQRALKDWLLERLEGPTYRKGTKDHPALTTTAQMADIAAADAEFLQVASLYRGRPDFDVAALVAELVEGESVPLLPILRYKPAGLRKREVWERTWNLQRREDAGEDVGEIPVPPKYATADFLKSDYWRLRGKLDVPKERWISFAHCSTESDPTLAVVWAGLNHLELATAIIAYYDARKREGWDAKRLTPLLAGLDQLLPWIHQWHSEIDCEFGETAGQSFQTMLERDAYELGLTLEDIRSWTPPATTTRTRRTRK